MLIATVGVETQFEGDECATLGARGRVLGDGVEDTVHGVVTGVEITVGRGRVEVGFSKYD